MFGRRETGRTLAVMSDGNRALLSCQLAGARFGQFGCDGPDTGPGYLAGLDLELWGPPLTHGFTSTRKVDVPSINRPLSGKALQFHLSEGHRSQLIDEELLAKGGRSARTLVKEGSLRVTLVALGPGGELREHQADGPITVYVLSGQIQFRAGADAWTLEKGDLLSLGAGVPHAVKSATGGEFLLTVATAVEP